MSGGTGDLIVYLPYDLAERTMKSIRVDTNSGGIMINYLDARELVVSTNSGSIDVSGCFNDVSIESNSGAIAFWGDAQTMTVETVSGEVFLSCGDMLEKLEADVNSGDITLLLPSWLGFSLEFDSVSGEMYSNSYDLYSNERFDFGDGTAALRIESVSGWLYLEQE